MNNQCQLYNGDCLDVLPTLEANSVDMVFADLPYGTTQSRWDTPIDLVLYWKYLKAIRKINAALVHTATQPFTSVLGYSNLAELKVSAVWNKRQAGNFAQGNKQPLKIHEDVLVFYARQPIYNPQKTIAIKNLGRHLRKPSVNRQDRELAGGIGGLQKYSDQYEPDKRLPTTIIEIAKDNYGSNIFHVAQKPVELIEYYIKTYTNEGDLVLDPTMGSGTTGVAALKLGRRFIGIEKDETIFNIAKQRIKQYDT